MDKTIRGSPEKRNVTLRVLSLLKTNKKTGLFLLLLVFLSTGFDIVVPFIFQGLMDNLIEFFKSGGGEPLGILITSSVGMLLATIAGRVSRSMYDYKTFEVVTTMEDKEKYVTQGKYYKMHALFHHGSSSGQIIGRIERGAQAIYGIFYDIFGHNFLPPLIVFLGTTVVLLFKNYLVALVVFLPLPIYIFSIKKITDKIYEIEKKANDQFEAVSKEAYDVAANILTVKKFHQEQQEIENQERLQRNARFTQYKAERLWSIADTIQTIIASLGRIGVVMLSGFLFLKGKSTVGEMVLYVTLQNMAYQPIHQLSTVFPRLRRNMARLERLFEIMDEPIMVMDKSNALSLPLHSRSVEFRNISFRYGRSAKWALKDVNVIIPAGKTAALVGRSGSGKTTFINLLLRSFDPQEGQVLIDGYDLRDIIQETLLDQVAVVPQEVDLFSRTILQNIAYGKPEVIKEEVVRAAKTALAHDFIQNTEQGYDTLVGERGIRLSGGERQRVGIARAVLRDPRILILDEATSHLDTESERLIAQAVDVLIKDRTTIIIAHRLSTVLRADMILVFEKGELEAIGKHEELLKISPTYQRLYELQFRSFDDGDAEEQLEEDSGFLDRKNMD